MDLSRVKISNILTPKTALSIVLQISILLLSFAYPLLYPPKANATVTTAFLRLDRQSTGAALSGVYCLRSTQTAGGVTKVVMSFPSTFSIAGTTSTWSVDTTAANLPNTSSGDAFTATAWPGISTNPAVVDTSTKAAIFYSTDLTNASNTYCFHFVGGASTVGSAGNDLTGRVTTQTVSGVAVETVDYATSITSGTNSEQIQVTASVSASFSFALSGGATGQSLPLGVLNSSTTSTAPYQVTGTVSTNARNGFLAWVKGTRTGGVLHSDTAGVDLTSTVASYPTITDLASATGYGLFAVTGTNSPTIAAGYSTGPAGTSVGKVDSTQFNALASKTGQQSGTTFNLGVRAKPSSTQTAANDYTDTLTVVASGSF